MVYKCCVPKCRGNYDHENKVRVFKFPEEENLKKLWISAIKRENFVPTKHSVVCELHFNAQDIRQNTVFNCEDGQEITLPLKVPRLKPGAVPSRLPNCPEYLSTPKSYRDSPQEKRARRENRNLQTAIEESEAEFNLQNEALSFSSFEELNDKIGLLNTPESWSVISKDNNILILFITFCPMPKVICSVVIAASLQLEVYYKEVKLDRIGDFLFPNIVMNISDIRNILERLDTLNFNGDEKKNSSSEILALASNILESVGLSNPDLVEHIEFVTEQIRLWSGQKRVYSPSFLILCSMLQSISPHSYAYLRHLNVIVLPHPCTIRRLCSTFRLDPRVEQHEENFLNYIKNKFSGNECDKFVVLMMDEVYVKPMMDYKGGNIVGKAFNSEKLATSAYCFMISSLLSDVKEMVHVLPVKSMSGEQLHCILKKIIIGLEEIGFHVVCVVSDNSSVNRKCMQQFSPQKELKCVYPHPVDEKRPLFFVFDSVHLLKCVRNNWLNQKDEDMCMNYPDFDPVSNDVHKASFCSVKKLQNIEHDKLVKYGYGLSVKALCPTSLERQNVKLVLQVFNENVIEGLKVMGEKCDLLHYKQTAWYIELMLNWWNIVNVRTPGKGARLNNILMCPVSSDSIEIVNYLHKFLQWLNKWKKLNVKGSLSSETMAAMILTTEGLLKLKDYCLSTLNFSYVLFGKFQTDVLEGRFGKYRQLAGGQYNISIRQVYEVEHKLRIQSSMSLKIKSNLFGEIKINELCEPTSEAPEFPTDEQKFIDRIYIDDRDFDGCKDDIPILVYLAGYCCYSVTKRLQCSHCKEILCTSEFIDLDDEAYHLIRDKDRGRLLVPEMYVVNVVVHNYLIVLKLCGDLESDFLKVENHRELVSNITMQFVRSMELLWEPDICMKGHTVENVCKKVVWVSTNILLNNYCKKRNSLPKSTFSKKSTIFYKR